MDIEKIRSGFPILERKLYNRPLVYLDNTATSQTPDTVVKAVVDGTPKHVYVCTRCLRSGKVTRAV